MLSIILNNKDEDVVVDYTEELLYAQITQMDAEVVRAPNFRQGLDLSEGEFLCYVEPDCLFSDNYFMVLLNMMAANAQYRKLAMVSPLLCLRHWDVEVHGYRVEDGVVIPNMPKKPKKSYLPDYKEKMGQIQVGYFPGSMIRRSAAERLYFDDSKPMKSSVENSLALWEEGNRIVLNSYVKYVSNRYDLDLPFKYGLVSAGVSKMFAREAI